MYCPFPVSPPQRTTSPKKPGPRQEQPTGTELRAQFPNPPPPAGAANRFFLALAPALVRPPRTRSSPSVAALGRQVGFHHDLGIVIWRSRSWIWFCREKVALCFFFFGVRGVQALICVTHLLFFLSARHPRRRGRRTADHGRHVTSGWRWRERAAPPRGRRLHKDQVRGGSLVAEEI